MRESRTYGSVRGACDETHVPTATAARVHHAARRRGGCDVAARGKRALVDLSQFELPGRATVTPRVPPRSMNFCTAPEALASSTNSLT